MAHYALLNEDNIVTDVFVGKNELELPEGYASREEYYADLYGQACKRTSYNTYGNAHKKGGTPFRYNYAGIDFSYDSEKDAFIPPKPWESWTLNAETCLWEPPSPMPQDENLYLWNEETKSWEAVDITEE